MSIVLGTATLLSTRQVDDDCLPDESVAMFLRSQQNAVATESNEPSPKPTEVQAPEEYEDIPEEPLGESGYGVANASWTDVKHEQWDEAEWDAWMKQHGYDDEDGWNNQVVKEESDTYPPWAYRSYDRSRSATQREYGIAGNIGRTDKLGGCYTQEGWTAPDGKPWESLVGVLGLFFDHCVCFEQFSL